MPGDGGSIAELRAGTTGIGVDATGAGSLTIAILSLMGGNLGVAPTFPFGSTGEDLEHLWPPSF